MVKNLNCPNLVIYVAYYVLLYLHNYTDTCCQKSVNKVIPTLTINFCLTISMHTHAHAHTHTKASKVTLLWKKPPEVLNVFNRENDHTWKTAIILIIKM